MINSYNSLKTLFDEKLNINENDVIFDVSLFNSEETTYEKLYDDEDGVTVTTKRIVPSHIVEI
ncbi:MAG: hypothetical protein GQ557_01480, partial [Mycoplasmataceae bacterium]|nr:hypothetical protein [Mycoplasmataceae bacterium]